MRFRLHENSVTIPSSELPGFFGSEIIAAEFRKDVKPCVDRHKCVLYLRTAASVWFHKNYECKNRGEAA